MSSYWKSVTGLKLKQSQEFSGHGLASAVPWLWCRPGKWNLGRTNQTTGRLTDSSIYVRPKKTLNSLISLVWLVYPGLCIYIYIYILIYIIYIHIPLVALLSLISHVPCFLFKPGRLWPGIFRDVSTCKSAPWNIGWPRPVVPMGYQWARGRHRGWGHQKMAVKSSWLVD